MPLSQGQLASNALTSLPQFDTPMKGYPRSRVPLVPDEPSAATEYSSTSLPAQALAPYALTGAALKSTSYQPLTGDSPF